MTPASSSSRTNRTPSHPKLTGDRVEEILEKTGLKSMSDRVHSWLGVPCGCQERKEKLNALDLLVRQVAKSGTDKAKQYLDMIIGEEKKDDET